MAYTYIALEWENILSIHYKYICKENNYMNIFRINFHIFNLLQIFFTYENSNNLEMADNHL